MILHDLAPRTCLLTGGSGYIGAFLLDLLLREGWKVRALQHLTPLRQTVHELLSGDLRECSPAWIEGVDVVFHLAARGNRAISERELRRINVEGTAGLVAALRAGKRAVRLIYASSIDVYSPLCNSDGLRSEAGPLDPLTGYGRTKLEAERCLEQWPYCSIVRLPMVVGQGDRHLARFRRLARWRVFPVTHGRFSAIDVRDAARLLLAAADDPRCGVFTVSDGRVYSWDDLARCCARLESVRVWRPRIPDGLLRPGLLRLLGNPDAAQYLRYDWHCRPNFPQGFRIEHAALDEPAR